MDFPAGNLDRRITIQRATVTQNDLGEEISTWATLGPATIAAAALPVSDSEKVAAAEVSATISMRFHIRYDSAWADVSPLDRVVFEGRTFDIWGAKQLGRREGIEITAAARAD
jgi:SPP1 family predicted phage head-tail adaptor